jgi:hypothetical protein
MEDSVYTNNDKVSQEIEKKMREIDKEYEKRVRDTYVQAAWVRWFDAVKKNRSMQQQLLRQ